MAPSFRRIDYSLRPAKHAERKMLLEAYRRLASFRPLSQYGYIGFGSVWFSDFLLFHRALGIPSMLSIERERSAEPRIRDNVPFSAVTPVFEKSSTALPKADWMRPQFVWLDYDDPLTPDALLDVRLTAGRALSGSILAISLQCHHASELDEAGKDGDPLELFFSRYGRSRVKQDTQVDDLYGRPFASVTRDLLSDELDAALKARDREADGGTMLAKKIFDVEYTDGVLMTTSVYLIHSEHDVRAAQACDFDNLEFVTDPSRLVRINVPKITPREARFLEAQLPRTAAYTRGNIPESDARDFADFYRFLPNFAAIEG